MPRALPRATGSGLSFTFGGRMDPSVGQIGAPDRGAAHGACPGLTGPVLKPATRRCSGRTRAALVPFASAASVRACVRRAVCVPRASPERCPRWLNAAARLRAAGAEPGLSQGGHKGPGFVVLYSMQRGAAHAARAGVFLLGLFRNRLITARRRRLAAGRAALARANVVLASACMQRR
jgi:hypothetical protein